MARPAAIIRLSPEEDRILKEYLRSSTTERRLVERARVILLASQGRGTEEIAQALHTRPARVSKWRQRFAKQRLAGLRDLARPGKGRQYSEATERRILAHLDQKPPAGYASWTGALLARALGDVSDDAVWRVLRKHGISLRRRRSLWRISTDPKFAAKAADVVGLYLNPPENALILSVDEKPPIKALERAQGHIRLAAGMRGYGTTALCAVLDEITAEVKTGYYQRRRRREFLGFMNEIAAAHPGREIHVVLDNLNTPKEDRWRQRHPQVHFHYTLTYSSWLDQVERWFGSLSRQASRGTSFTSPRRVREALDRFMTAYNQKAALRNSRPYLRKWGLVVTGTPEGANATKAARHRH